MDLKNFFQQVGKRFRREKRLPDEAVQGFVRVLEKARAEDFTCDQMFAQLDEYVENELRGEDMSLIMPMLREHLDFCSDCCDEYEALLSVIQKHSSK
jgi:hypothetical protein